MTKRKLPLSDKQVIRQLKRDLKTSAELIVSKNNLIADLQQNLDSKHAELQQSRKNFGIAAHRVTTLEQEKVRVIERYNDYRNQCQEKYERIQQLERENSELLGAKESSQKRIENLSKRIVEMKAEWDHTCDINKELQRKVDAKSEILLTPSQPLEIKLIIEVKNG